MGKDLNHFFVVVVLFVLGDLILILGGLGLRGRRGETKPVASNILLP